MLRVLTWNVWWRFGPWRERQAAIAATLADVDADVVCLQEVWAEEGGEDQAATLAAGLGHHHVSTPPVYWDGMAFGNAVLSRWPIVSTEARLLPAEEEDSTRSVLYALLNAPFGSVPVFTTHLEWRYDAAALRRRQVDVLARFVAERRGDPERDFPPVVTGDLNATPDADPVRALTGAAPVPVPGLVFHDAWEQAGDGSPGHTWSRDNPYLAEATWPARRLDYVFVGWPRARPRGNPVSCRLVGADPVDDVIPSDHYGVVADLRT